jgi:MFS transporter, CP family, cyanate transporter
LLIVGLLLIASNFRAPITGVAPVLEMLQSAFGLSPAQAGLLTTLPLLAFGIISPFAAVFGSPAWRNAWDTCWRHAARR